MAINGPTVDHYEIQSWAEAHRILPVELYPHTVDHEPASMRLLPTHAIAERKDVRTLSWAEFFERFDLLGLSCVYDSDATGYNEILQIEGRSPYRNPEYDLDKESN